MSGRNIFSAPPEKAFYDVLDELVGEDVVICPKPAVREVLRGAQQRPAGPAEIF